VPNQIPGLLLRGEFLPDVGGPLGKWKDGSVYQNDAVQKDPSLQPEEANESLSPYMGSMNFDSVKNMTLPIPFRLQGDYLLNGVLRVGPPGHPVPVFPEQYPFGRQSTDGFALKLENNHVSVGLGPFAVRVLVPNQANEWLLWQVRVKDNVLKLFRNGVDTLTTGRGVPGAIEFNQLGGGGNGVGLWGALHISVYPWGVSDTELAMVTSNLLSDYSDFIGP